jgi:ADP-heptose:LPS heptosyltransferase
VDYLADRVLDGRKRPDNVERLGFDMWKKHEVLYQMENAYELGFSGMPPGPRFFGAEEGDPDLIYLGIGYKRDVGGFGLSKHFGNERFVDLIKAIRARRPSARFVSTGGVADLIQVAAPIMKRIADPDVYRCDAGSGLPYAFSTVGRCGSYIGNDTGMMHVAASLEMPTHGLFLSQDLARKNHPWGTPRGRWMGSSLDADVDEIADYFVRLVWGEGVGS